MQKLEFGPIFLKSALTVIRCCDKKTTPFDNQIDGFIEKREKPV